MSGTAPKDTVASAPVERRGICVIGRTGFQSGIGTVTAAAAELLSRRYDVSIYEPRAPAADGGSAVELPSGRVVPLVSRPDDFAVYFFTDVLWNGFSDTNYQSVPEGGFRIAHMAYDSDILPEEWVRILNERFDLALFSSEYLLGVAAASGVTIPTAFLPIGLDLEPMLARRYRAPMPNVTRFGTISAFHTRKGLDLLVEAFLREFGGDPSAELVIHSNLAFGDVYARVKSLMVSAGATNVHVQNSDLSVEAKNDLIDSFDVYVNVSVGEGYSIGPREALALGKSLVLSNIAAHEDMQGLPGVFAIEPIGYQPAVYPEIENRIMGRQSLLDVASIQKSLRLAKGFASSPEIATTSAVRRRRAGAFSFTTLESEYAAFVDPDSAWAAKLAAASHTEEVDVATSTLTDDLVDPIAATAAVPRARAFAGRHGTKLGARKIVVPAHDGGFFSVFNTYFTHLVWGTIDNEAALVLPDWRAEGVIERAKGEPVVSYCYGKPYDGNVWLKMFEPVFDLSADELNDPERLYAGAELPEPPFNHVREPNLTYVNAHNLYTAHDFYRFRKQYNTVLDRHVRLVPEYRSEIDTFVNDQISGRFTIGVHVKHPSHAVEQVGGAMADRFAYVTRVRDELARRGINPSDEGWAVFVATDQERVTQLFHEEFGNHVVAFNDVVRSSSETDDEFDLLSDDEKLQDGHQLQHQMAANTKNWSHRLAWEVWRDAEALAASDVVIHAVSNVATAVAYMNPNNEMRYFAG
ncbi:glycosyltransferase [Glaciihabitans sp. dw_435]|uniref:glycosyltransferase n=1 Tax=Glaciihabitans sp. dw_435 TaxID=2720081 RepID=UPI001BD2D014|nr:hypothetical protein [Glaciihabitans sp. dw_435]